MLNSRDFISGRSVVFGDFGLYNYFGVEFIRDNKIRSLVKAGNSLGTFRLPVTDTGLVENVLDCQFQIISDKLAHGIPVPGKWPPEESFVKKDRVRYANP